MILYDIILYCLCGRLFLVALGACEGLRVDSRVSRDGASHRGPEQAAGKWRGCLYASRVHASVYVFMNESHRDSTFAV
jgi:hypothetical protein